MPFEVVGVLDARQPEHHLQVIVGWGGTGAALENGVDRRVEAWSTLWALQSLGDLRALATVSDEAHDLLAPDFDLVRREANPSGQTPPPPSRAPCTIRV